MIWVIGYLLVGFAVSGAARAAFDWDVALSENEKVGLGAVVFVWPAFVAVVVGAFIVEVWKFRIKKEMS